LTAWLLELLLLCGKTYASATIVYAKRKNKHSVDDDYLKNDRW
jgi:hypothetical protein